MHRFQEDGSRAEAGEVDGQRPERAAPGDPQEASAGRKRWPFWAVVFGSWTVVGLFYATRPFVHALALRQPIPDQSYLLHNLADAYAWAVFTPAILELARRFPFGKPSWAGPLVVHLVAGMAFATLSVAVNVGVARLLPGRETPVFARYFASTFHWNLQWYGILVGIGHAVEYYRKYRDRELRTSQLETQLARAQLETLKMQLQPHFLFNTLNVISELVHVDPLAADRIVIRLGDLLRLSVDSSGAQEVPLRHELDFLRAYVEIQRARFGDHLSVTMEIQPETLDALVPNLLLQPLVENAIKHGIAPRGAPGSVRVFASRSGGLLLLQVRDDGVGLRNRGAGIREGVGVGNTRARLQQLYGSDYHFELRNGPSPAGGVTATVLIPFRSQAPAPTNGRRRRESFDGAHSSAGGR